jgi:hypothetical protein
VKAGKVINPTPEGVKAGLVVLNAALQHGWDFVLCVNAGERGSVRVTQTNMRNKLKVARMLENFARRARKGAK